MWKLQAQFFKFLILSLCAVLVSCNGDGGFKNTGTMDELFSTVKEINRKLTEIARDASQLSKEVEALRNQNSELNAKLEEHRKDENGKLSSILEKLNKIEETFIEVKTQNQKSLQPLQEFSSTLEELKQLEKKQTTILEDFSQSLSEVAVPINITNSANFSHQLKLALDESSTSYSSCDEAIKYNGHSGVYSLRVPNSEYSSFKVYCLKEEKFGGSAWTIIQRRDMKSGHSIDFNRTWEEYKNGFGDPEYDHWLGLDKIYMLTSSSRYSLFEITFNEYITVELAYYNFTIADESEDFRLTSLDESDKNRFMFYCLNTPFNTIDRGNTTWVEYQGGGGGFWGPCDTNYNSQLLRDGKWIIHYNSPSRDAVFVQLAIRQVSD